MLKIKIQKKQPVKLKFPEGFLWGAGSSAYQVEGGITQNDWATSEKIAPAGLACDHYHRFEEDFKLAKKLGHNAVRLSCEWSRIEPLKDHWDEAELDHYLAVLKYLKKKKFQVFLTLHHFTNPLWIAQAGGWASRHTIDQFEKYVTKVCQSLGQYVDFWVTINEPNVYAGVSYALGVWPPYKKNYLTSFRVYQNMLAAHNRGYDIIHYFFPHTAVGFSQNLAWNEPARTQSVLDRTVVNISDWFNLDFAYQQTKSDFIGLNHYFHNRLKFSFSKLIKSLPPAGEVTDKNWEIYPEAIYNVLMTLGKFNKPIYVTENGIADHADTKRETYIKNYLRQIHKAVRRGADVRGYLYWSLLDNYEWPDNSKETGYEAKFGLVEVDFATQARKIRASARVFARICQANTLEI